MIERKIMNSNSTNRRIANGLQKFAKPIPLAGAVVTSPTCSVNIKDAKRPKVVVSITARIVTVPDRYLTAWFSPIERVTLINGFSVGIFYEVGSHDKMKVLNLKPTAP